MTRGEALAQEAAEYHWPRDFLEMVVDKLLASGVNLREEVPWLERHEERAWRSFS